MDLHAQFAARAYDLGASDAPEGARLGSWSETAEPQRHARGKLPLRLARCLAATLRRALPVPALLCLAVCKQGRAPPMLGDARPDQPAQRSRLLHFCSGTAPLSSDGRAPAHHESDERENDEQNEQHLRDARGTRGNAAKTEQGGDQSDD